MSKRALVLVDIQNDYFAGGKWPLDGVEAAADNAARVLAQARATGDFVVHIRHEFNEPDAPFFQPGTEGAQTHAKVANLPGEPVVLKHHVNAFLETSLKALLDEQGVEQLTIVGNMSHMCVDALTRAAADYGYANTVIADACATHDQTHGAVTVPAAHVQAAFMAALAFAYAEVLTTDDYLTRTA